VSDQLRENDGTQFDRLPKTGAVREVEGRPSREAVVDWWVQRFGVPEATFDEYTLWEKGKGKVWALPYDLQGPVPVEALGLKVLRTRQEHWKPTTDAVQRFGRAATKNVVELDDTAAKRFVAGETQELDWDGDWGYLVAAQELAGDLEPIGVGLFTHGELKSMIPKGHQRDL
jgi:NOL1/NOP2/fmu family ribosome biogenesis protein